MNPTHRFPPAGRRGAALLIASLLAVGCTQAETAAPASASASVESFVNLMQTYLHDGVTNDDFDVSRLEAVAAGLHPESSVDLVALDTCLQQRYSLETAAMVDIFELAFNAFQAYPIGAELTIVAYHEASVVPDAVDRDGEHALYVTPLGIVGERSQPDEAGGGCWNAAMTNTGAALAAFDEAAAADEPGFEPRPDDEPAAPGAANASEAATSAEAEWVRRPGFPADPSDPEPISSTGANKWDLIRADDPSAFSCLTYLGQGPEEILDRTKSGYEQVPDAYLYLAEFTDGTSIDIRVHPEVGSHVEATAEVERITIPLGQLPTVLRQGIGRFAIRLGDETATGSQGEGISMQSGNITTRVSDDRLEETLLHESVHTSLDATYAYTRSAEWLAAQDADGRFLTEYGRDNPDSEDLAESVLYAYAITHYPGRVPGVVEAEIKARIRNRIAFIAELIPADQPIFTPSDGAIGC